MDAPNSGLTRYSGHSSMHRLISLYYCTKKTPLWFPDSGHFGLNAVIQCNDNHFLTNRQWAGHNNQCMYMHGMVYIIHIMYSQSKSQQVWYFTSKNQPGLRHSDPLKSSPSSRCLLVSDSVGTTSSCSLLVFPISVSLAPSCLRCLCFLVSILSKLLKLWNFLEHRGYVEQATSVGKVMINLAGISVYNYTQTTIIIDQYFS